MNPVDGRRLPAAAALLAALVVAAPGRPADGADQEPVTFNRQIAPILFRQCAACHRPGEVAPFPLLGYEDAKKRARQIQGITARRAMPPWKEVEGRGKFDGERRLTDDEIAL